MKNTFSKKCCGLFSNVVVWAAPDVYFSALDGFVPNLAV